MIGATSLIGIGFLLGFLTASAAWSQDGNPAAQAEQESSSPETVALAAKVGGDVIALDALDKRLAEDKERSAEVEGADAKLVYLAKRAKLEELIAEVLIQQEAARRGVEPQALVDSLIRDVEVTDEDVDLSYRLAKQYQKKKGAHPMLMRRVDRLLAGSEAEARERIREFNVKEKKRVKLLTFANGLKEKTKVEVFLSNPGKEE